MQALWSRAAQTRPCRCGPCLNAASAVGRRVTTAATKRRLKASDVFTACYSAMFATAALADAKIKDDRRKQWDAAIEEVKTGSTWSPTALDPRHTQEAARKQINSLSEEGLGIEHPNSYDPLQYSRVERSTRWRSLSRTQETPLEAQLRVLDEHMKQISTQKIVVENSDVHKLATDEDSRPNSNLLSREPKTSLQLEKMQEMVSKLVAKLLLEVKTFSSKLGTITQDGVTVDDLDSQKKILADRVRELRASGTQLPKYRHPTHEDIWDDKTHLNRSISTLLKTKVSSKPQLDLIVAKVCYNLLVSRAPPTINTYNILIKHFTRLQLDSLAEVVLDSLANDSRFKPNETTIVLMLNHYTVTRQKESFTRTVRQMRGVEDGLRVKRRHLSALEDIPVQRWAMSSKVVHRNGHLYEKVTRNAEIFEALIRGSLQLFGLQRALMYLKAALREGVSVSTELFNHILSYVWKDKSGKSHVSLLNTISAQWTGEYSHTGLTYCREVRGKVYQVLKRLSMEQPKFACIPESVRVPGIDWRGLDGMMRHITYERVLDRVRELVVRAAKVDSKAELGGLDRRTHCEDIVHETLSLLYGGLSRHYQEVYDKSLKSSPEWGIGKRAEVLFGLWRDGNNDVVTSQPACLKVQGNAAPQPDAVYAKVPGSLIAEVDYAEGQRPVLPSLWTPPVVENLVSEGPLAVAFSPVHPSSRGVVHMQNELVLRTKAGVSLQLPHLTLSQDRYRPTPLMRSSYRTFDDLGRRELRAVA